MTERPPAVDDFAVDDFALARRSTPLQRLIADEIAAHGPITFARFMALALGHPEHGYYARADLRWGAAGDYETSPQVHPVFGYLWARQIAECWERLGRPEPFRLIEPGAGSGAFAAAILAWLRERAPECAAAARPLLLDGHPRRLEEQRSALAALGLEAEHRLLDDWLAGDDDLGTGVIISNEFFDALPAHLVDGRGDDLVEWYVDLAPAPLTLTAEGGGAGMGRPLRLVEGPPSTPAIAGALRAVGAWPGDNCRAEVSLAARDAMSALAARLDRGYLLTLDYGYEAAELYASWRRMGTLMAFRDHSPQPDPLAEPGRLDLTAHVDFTALAQAARGWEAAPLVSQAEALVALGLGEQLAAAQRRAAEDAFAFAEARRAADTLLDPAGLGRVRVLVQAKDAPLEGLACLREVMR